MNETRWKEKISCGISTRHQHVYTRQGQFLRDLWTYYDIFGVNISPSAEIFINVTEGKRLTITICTSIDFSNDFFCLFKCFAPSPSLHRPGFVTQFTFLVQVGLCCSLALDCSNRQSTPKDGRNRQADRYTQLGRWLMKLERDKYQVWNYFCQVLVAS